MVTASDPVGSPQVHIVSVGGTIGASTLEDRISVTDDGASGLEVAIESFCKSRDITWESSAPYSVLSEQMDPQHWVDVVDQIQQVIDSGVNSIVITHGTDTMAYTAAALGMIFRDVDARIVLTGSFFSFDHPKSDLVLNISAAILAATASNLENGVFVSFGDSTGAVPVIPALDLLPMRFDSRQFDTRYDNFIGLTTLDKGFRHYNQALYQSVAQPFKLERPATWAQYGDIQSQIFQLPVYPGMDAKAHTKAMPSGSIVIVSAYHSGTADGRTYSDSLAEVIESRSDLTFVLGPIPTAVDPLYASTVNLLELGARAYRDLTNHCLYVWFVLGQMAGLSPETLFAEIKDKKVAI